MLSLFNKTVDILSGMLNYREKRHQVILSNIANLDVPDYQAAELVLKNAGARADNAPPAVHLRTTHGRHLAPKPVRMGAPGECELTVREEKGSLDREMATLSENHLMYNATIEMLARKFRGLNAVLKETK
jgi:flagellar basal-body rod protein FlgB